MGEADKPQALSDLQQYLVDEFVEDYQEGELSRREALRYIAAVTGSFFFAGTLLAACGPSDETASQVATPGAAGLSTTAEATQAETAAGTVGTPAEGATEPAPDATAPSEESQATVAGSDETAAATAPAGDISPTATAEETVIATEATATVPQASETTGPPAAVRVAEDDPAVRAESVEFPGEGTTLMGYLARPSADGTFPIVLVCHENRGLTDHIRDVTRRLAKAGYAALAVDLLSRQGGTAAITDPAQIPGALGNATPEQMVGDLRSGMTYLQSQPYVQGDRVGMVGFCFGGGITWRAATQIPELGAAVPFYGPNPPIEDVPAINAPVFAMYGEQDERINAGIPEIEAAMRENNKVFRYQIFPGAGHAFHNDTGRNYNAEAAQAAWAQTLAWFDQYLRTA